MDQKGRMLSQEEIDNLLAENNSTTPKDNGKEKDFMTEFESDFKLIEKEMSSLPIKNNVTQIPKKIMIKPFDTNTYICDEHNVVMIKNTYYRPYPATPKLILTCPICNVSMLIQPS